MGRGFASENQERVTVTEDIFDTRTQRIVKSILDANSAEVATAVAGYLSKKLIKQSKCRSCDILLKAGDGGIANDAYSNIFSRGGQFVPSKSLADFVCSNFAILDFVDR